MNNKPDKIDMQILSILQSDARIQLKALAEKVFLSSPATSARLERLEREGYILGYKAQVNRLALGLHITAFINLAVDPTEKPQFYPFITESPYVLECNCVTGEYSMLIKAAFHSTIELDAFINKLQRFGKTNTQIVFSTSVAPRGIDFVKLEERSEQDKGEYLYMPETESKKE
ncbi:MAG: Lrp/AsnC family transcriptional regulator [Clostridiales Family XIII bacterium]|jgi:Lrp/AsnC family leucine-responsive transcriptional regulator|nr:Lrp/AsnC family transcriptional regulator [Clostridiales Family XIII bacterium]